MEFFMINQIYKRIYVISSDCFSLSKKKKDDVMMLVFPVKKKECMEFFMINQIYKRIYVISYLSK